MQAKDADGVEIAINKEFDKEIANNIEKYKETLITQFSKTGKTIFRVVNIETTSTNKYFITAIKLAERRRETTARILKGKGGILGVKFIVTC